MKEKEIVVKGTEEFMEDYENLQQEAKNDVAKGRPNSENIQLLKAIDRELDNLKIDPFKGTQIKKKQIPKEIIDKYDIPNLWKIDLPFYWRVIYSVLSDKIEIISLVLEFMDHDEYNKLFGYKQS